MRTALSPTEIVHQQLEYGVTQIELVRDATALSRVFINPMTLTIGVARVRVAGIGGVWTDERYRMQGYARQLMEGSVAHMLEAAAAGAHQAAMAEPASLSILWGIPNFYEKFGYTPAAPDVLVSLTDLPHSDPVPQGWSVRSCETRDVAAIQSLYERASARSVGAVVRPPDGRVWSKLAEIAHEPAQDECRVVVRPDGQVAGYAWRGRDFWPVNTAEESPKALAIGETVACETAAADALLAACRIWAQEEAVRRPAVESAELYLPLNGAVYAAAARQNARVELTWHRSGSYMIRSLSTRGLLAALVPELSRRLRATRVSAFGTLGLVTETGTVQLELAPDGVALRRDGGGDRHGTVTQTLVVPQQVLAQLAFGTFPAGDLLDRLARPPDGIAREWVELLFPQRQPYTHVLDWI